MRTKDVQIGETIFHIAGLSCGQVDEIVFAEFGVKEENGQIVAVVQGTKRAMRSRLCPVVAAGLNNRITGDGKWFLNGWSKPADVTEKWWMPEDVFGELDYEEIITLYAEITSLSKLKSEIKKGADKAPVGEGTAATGTT